MHCADSALVMPHALMQRFYPYRRSIILGVHLLLISLGYLAAYAVRFDFAIPPEELHRWAVTLPWLLIPRLLFFQRFSAYSGWWRYVGMADLVNLCVAVSLSSVVFVAGVVFLGRVWGWAAWLLVFWRRDRSFLSTGAYTCVACLCSGPLST